MNLMKVRISFQRFIKHVEHANSNHNLTPNLHIVNVRFVKVEKININIKMIKEGVRNMKKEIREEIKKTIRDKSGILLEEKKIFRYEVSFEDPIPSEIQQLFELVEKNINIHTGETLEKATKIINKEFEATFRILEIDPKNKILIIEKLIQLYKKSELEINEVTSYIQKYRIITWNLRYRNWPKFESFLKKGKLKSYIVLIDFIALSFAYLWLQSKKKDFEKRIYRENVLKSIFGLK
jgi:hypothetical protein